VTISFDLDDTIIPGIKKFDTEKQTMFQRMCGVEKIRTGTIELVKALQTQGHKVFVYTTSLRTTKRIWFTFFCYGIRFDKIINQTTHQRTLRENHKNYSKYPPAFNIDIHVDDSKGVEMEGTRYNFKTIIVTEDNLTWTDFILRSISKASLG